jgi:hypothetical protein
MQSDYRSFLPKDVSGAQALYKQIQMVPFTLMMATNITIPNGIRQCEPDQTAAMTSDAVLGTACNKYGTLA